MRRVGFDSIRFAFAVGVYKFYRDEVGIGHGVRVCDGEGIFVDGFYGSPDVDDLEPTLE